MRTITPRKGKKWVHSQTVASEMWIADMPIVNRFKLAFGLKIKNVNIDMNSKKITLK